MKKFVVLEGIDACGKTFLRERIQDLSQNDIVSVNRNTNVNISGKDLSTFDFSKNWFKDRTIDISPTIKTYVSIIQIRYLYENIDIREQMVHYLKEVDYSNAKVEYQKKWEALLEG